MNWRLQFPWRIEDNCAVMRSRLAARLDGALPPREAAAVRAHLDGCSACQAEATALADTVALLRALPTVAAPRSFALAAPAARTKPASWLAILPGPRPLGAATALAAAAFAVTLTFSQLSQIGQFDPMKPAGPSSAPASAIQAAPTAAALAQPAARPAMAPARQTAEGTTSSAAEPIGSAAVADPSSSAEDSVAVPPAAEARKALATPMPAAAPAAPAPASVAPLADTSALESQKSAATSESTESAAKGEPAEPAAQTEAPAAAPTSAQLRESARVEASQDFVAAGAPADQTADAAPDAARGQSFEMAGGAAESNELQPFAANEAAEANGASALPPRTTSTGLPAKSDESAAFAGRSDLTLVATALGALSLSLGLATVVSWRARADRGTRRNADNSRDSAGR